MNLKVGDILIGKKENRPYSAVRTKHKVLKILDGYIEISAVARNSHGIKTGMWNNDESLWNFFHKPHCGHPLTKIFK
jgi:hypothetical protein